MANHKLPVYPKDHALGSIVPEGGSSCAKCEYLRAGGNCAEEHFQYWNGGKKIPGPINAYCCDFFEVAPKILDVKLEDVGC
jgi:hypothetical protein